MLGSLFSAGASLIGGILGNKAKKKEARRQEYLNSPQGIRDQSEAAGFNPLTVMGSGRVFGAQYNPTFGNTLANIGQIVADGISGEEQLKIQKAELELERERVRKVSEALAVGPKVPGVYDQRRATGQRGVTEGEAPQPPATKRRGPQLIEADEENDRLGATSDIAPGRDTMVMPYSTGPGVTEIENDLLTDPIMVPGADGEPWGVDELLTAAAVGAPQILYNDVKRTAQRVRDNYNDVIAEPFDRYVLRPILGDNYDAPANPPKKGVDRKDDKKAKEYREHMKRLYPTPFD